MTRNSVIFGTFNVTSQVFYQSSKSFGLVNLKPILPGHVMVCPKRVVSRLNQLEPDEAIDFYATVQNVAKAIEEYTHADALNIAIQDGALAGQSVPHVHCHIIPRRLKDLPNVDDVYKLLDEHEGNMDAIYRKLRKANAGAFAVDSELRPPRSEDEMAAEATSIRDFIHKWNKID